MQILDLSFLRFPKLLIVTIESGNFFVKMLIEVTNFTLVTSLFSSCFIAKLLAINYILVFFLVDLVL
jgi:hypothetical protein